MHRLNIVKNRLDVTWVRGKKREKHGGCAVTRVVGRERKHFSSHSLLPRDRPSYKVSLERVSHHARRAAWIGQVHACAGKAGMLEGRGHGVIASLGNLMERVTSRRD